MCPVKHCLSLKLCVMNNKDGTETSQEVSTLHQGVSWQARHQMGLGAEQLGQDGLGVRT